ncbi:CLUMA_CG005214, isoform A [Clunio marinus]|uniref:CLUMA_CG005214, isoform A n=1 Tax=Clunio marinus TaxID=568069 RepID=A0A1J1HU11_9DIPT|nr:CLUMA_CG005214, isoform A [Clunio marinus]
MPQTLFKKGKKASLRSEHDDIWDDTLLIKAYEESVRLQKEEVAKQLAMNTNKKQKSDEEVESSDVEGDIDAASTSGNEDFKVGDYVRCTFADDGVDYEAEILSINENGNCIIRYIGYGNEERVSMENLVASWGPEAREEQKILAEADQHESSEKEEHHEGLHNFILNKSQGVRDGLPVPPMPPMPPAMFSSSGESEYMSAMLMSWYMSGYYTGLYHGRKQVKEEIEAEEMTSALSSSKETPIKKKKLSRKGK